MVFKVLSTAFKVCSAVFQGFPGFLDGFQRFQGFLDGSQWFFKGSQGFQVRVFRMLFNGSKCFSNVFQRFQLLFKVPRVSRVFSFFLLGC